MIRVVAVVLGLLLAVFAAPAKAAPAPYVVGFCADPRTGTAIGSKSLPPAWNIETKADWHSLSVDCQSPPGANTGIHLQSVATTRPGPGSVSIKFTPPDDVTIVGLDYYRWLRSVEDMGVSAYATNVLVDAKGVEESCYPGGCGRGAPGALAFAPANRFIWTATAPSTRLLLSEGGGTCYAAPGGGCQPAAQSDGNVFHIWGGLISLLDSTPPLFTRNPDGPLIDPSTPRAGVQELTFAATDKGGGLRRGVITVDGKDVQTYDLDDNRGACREPYFLPLPCKLAVETTLAFDTTKVPDGAHRVDFRIEDVSGNVAAYGPVAISVRNSSAADRGPINGVGASDRASLRLTYRGKARASLSRRYGRSTIVRGLLRNDARKPIGQADVRVIETLDQVNAAPVDRGAARTDDAGRFEYRIAPGPSRTVRFVYRSHLNDSVEAAGFAVRLRVPARVTLGPKRRSVRRGRTLALTGRLLGRPLPAAGKLVELEARERGRWRQAATARTSARGRFTVRYRFSRRARRATFPMRVRVRRDGSYPYAQGFSRTVLVRVR